MISSKQIAGTFAGVGVGLALGGPVGALIGGAGVFAWNLLASARRRFGAALVKEAFATEGLPQGSAELRALTAPLDPATANWCAATVQGWIKRAAARTGLHPSVVGSPQAKAIIPQFKDAKDAVWYDVAELRARPSLMEPGMIAVWTRGDPSSWTGHIGLVIQAGKTIKGDRDPQAFVTMEGNNLPKIARFDHPLSSTSLLGMGRFNV